MSTGLTRAEKDVFARIAEDNAYYSRVRAQIRKKHFLKERHQATLEEWI